MNSLVNRYVQKAQKKSGKDKECWLCLGKYSSEPLKIITREISSSPSELAQIVLNILVKLATDKATFNDKDPETIYTVERAK